MRFKHPSKANLDWQPDRKTNTATGTKKNEPTRRQIYNRTTPREKGRLGEATRNLSFFLFFISKRLVRRSPLLPSPTSG